MYWGRLALDRTIALPAIIAFSQKIFGGNMFSIYIPNILAGSLMLYLTSQIYKELFKYYLNIYEAYKIKYILNNNFHIKKRL